ncbi:MAG: DUF4197 domain-containing protein [Bacteroidales bacterium]|nr:DUF4197 domain-containing protein [Bacteroidales bacterium]
MKKNHLLLIVFVALFFVSCEDNSGKYVKRHLTTTEMENAFEDCLLESIDYAIDNLCPEDTESYNQGYGFYQYPDTAKHPYRITLPSSAKVIIDSLTVHGQSELIDNLILHINRAAESCESSLTSAFSSAIRNIRYSNPQSLLSTSSSNAITKYFMTQCGTSLQSSFQTPLQIKMSERGIPTEWNNILQIYYSYNPQPVSIDLTSSITSQMLNGIYAEMAKMEELIRTNEAYRTTDDLELVFGN